MERDINLDATPDQKNILRGYAFAYAEHPVLMDAPQWHYILAARGEAHHIPCMVHLK